MTAFHRFVNEDGDEYGSFEVWYQKDGELNEEGPQGWYWWQCFPGCLPDGDATGPFKDEIDAIADAMSHA